MRLFKRNQTQRNQQLSDDELQRTQVLNLQAFKETARIEKLSSKKPAIIMAVIGVLSISLGLAFPAIQSLSTRQNAEKNQQNTLKRRQSEETIKKVVEEEMICTHQDLNKPNGTDEVIDVTYKFKDDKLYASKKEYKLVKSAAAPTDPAELGSYLTALQSFLMQINGYSVTVQTIEHGSITTTEVNYTIIDLARVPESHKTNYRFDIPNQNNDSKETVKTTMTGLGYTCRQE